MNYEKKYKEALEKARQFSERPLEEDSSSIVEYIFPELKESGDEKIRKWLIEWAKAVNWSEQFTVTKEQVLAWLEKQGEPIDDNIITRDDEILQAISIGLTDAVENFGWSDFGGLPIEEIQEWLEKQEGCEHIKKEWTTSDAATLKELIDFLENGTAKLQHDLTRYANWLKIQFTPIEKKSEQKSTDKAEPIPERR